MSERKSVFHGEPVPKHSPCHPRAPPTADRIRIFHPTPPGESGKLEVRRRGVYSSPVPADRSPAPESAATPARMRDLVTVSEIRTVVRLSDRKEAAWSAYVRDAFVETADVTAVLAGLAETLRATKGGGAFVQGPYGSGKSHLLAYLHLALEGSAPSPLADFAQLPISVSLVAHASSESLEEIVVSEIEQQASAALPGLSLSVEPRVADELLGYLTDRRPKWLAQLLRETGAPEARGLFRPPHPAFLEARVKAEGLPFHLGPQRDEVMTALGATLAAR